MTDNPCPLWLTTMAYYHLDPNIDPSLQQDPGPSEKQQQSQSAMPVGQGKAQGQVEHRIARAISACTRCRNRKSKCDGKLPACTACERAKVECVGFDAVSKSNVSRSYLHTLETEVAALRAEVASLRSNTPQSQVTPQSDSPGTSLHPYPDSARTSGYSPSSDYQRYRSKPSFSMDRCVSPASRTNIPRMVSDAAQRIGHAGHHVSILGQKRQLSPDSTRSSKRQRKCFDIPPLPPKAAVDRLIAAYMDFVGVIAPILYIPQLGKQLQSVRDDPEVSQGDVFVVMMVLALATMASSRFVEQPDELRACSEAFHAEALKHSDAAFAETGYAGLQAILLLTFYSLLNPDKGSVWFLVGLATRTCVDLGYHNETTHQTETLDPLELEMRRRLFWITYNLDRLLSQSLGRPPAIPDEFINVPLPTPYHEIPLPGQPPRELCSYKAIMLHSIPLRQLQSEIITRLYSARAIESPPDEQWFEDAFSRLKDWLATTPEPKGAMTTEGFAISFHNTCLLLFRPSPASPRPPRESLATVLASSSYIIRIYRRMQLTNRINWFWLTSHYAFMAGVSFLYGLWNLHALGGGYGVPTVAEAMMDIEACLAVLEHLSVRVPSAAECHATYSQLSSAILSRLSHGSPHKSAANPIRALPVSSARDDGPTPLPPTELPYELSLLDHLFLNPMGVHAQASTATQGGQETAGEHAHLADPKAPNPLDHLAPSVPPSSQSLADNIDLFAMWMENGDNLNMQLGAIDGQSADAGGGEGGGVQDFTMWS